jgi:hypothetical protein
MRNHVLQCASCASNPCAPMISSPASWFLASIAVLPFEGVSDDTETGEQEGIEVRLWRAVLFRAHCAARSGRPVPQTGTARSLSGSVGVRRSTDMDRRTCRFARYHALTFLPEGGGRVSKPGLFSFPSPTCSREGPFAGAMPQIGQTPGPTSAGSVDASGRCRWCIPSAGRPSQSQSGTSSAPRRSVRDTS